MILDLKILVQGIVKVLTNSHYKMILSHRMHKINSLRWNKEIFKFFIRCNSNRITRICKLKQEGKVILIYNHLEEQSIIINLLSIKLKLGHLWLINKRLLKIYHQIIIRN